MKGKTVASSSNQQQSVSIEDEIPDDIEASKEEQESEEYDTKAAEDMVTNAFDEGSEEKDDVKEREVGWMMDMYTVDSFLKHCYSVTNSAGSTHLFLSQS